MGLSRSGLSIQMMAYSPHIGMAHTIAEAFWEVPNVHDGPNIVVSSGASVNLRPQVGSVAPVEDAPGRFHASIDISVRVNCRVRVACSGEFELRLELDDDLVGDRDEFRFGERFDLVGLETCTLGRRREEYRYNSEEEDTNRH